MIFFIQNLVKKTKILFKPILDEKIMKATKIVKEFFYL